MNALNVRKEQQKPGLFSDWPGNEATISNDDFDFKVANPYNPEILAVFKFGGLAPNYIGVKNHWWMWWWGPSSILPHRTIAM